ncbi:MAG TPA: DUF4089 domain-containing protein [Paracoccaceae bacterium]|nr:DUF4089 domain-containing protein [Paracoccaceae bacterium]
MKEAELDRLIEAMAAFLGLKLEKAYRPGIRAHLAAARAMAAIVQAHELEDDAEPAPVYRP